MKTACLALVLACLGPGIYPGSQDAPNAIPIIRLDKTRFVLGEDIFFWEGVEQTSHAPIPKKYQETCRRTITRPDGTQKTENVGWPIDGPPDSGWLGGAGLGADTVQLGRYKLVFEFAGQKTLPTFLFVEDVPILKQIRADFVFGDLRNDPATLEVHIPTSENVTLVVHNGSDQTLRFPRLGGSGRFVSVSIRKVDGSYSNELFYPHYKLSNQKESEVGSISFDRFTWEIARKVPTITLKPGETYRQDLLLQTAFDEAKKSLPLDPGEYKVTFSTELQILIGEKDGRWVELSPVRLAVGSTATCVITR
jgi:hypothetical protein